MVGNNTCAAAVALTVHSRDEKAHPKERHVPDLIDLIPDSHRDLVRSSLTAAFTTIDGQGRPQSTAVWFLLDDDGKLKGSVTSDRQKYKNLSVNPECDLLIIDPADPFRTLEIRARATLVADPDYAMLARIAKAYGVDESLLIRPGDERYTVEYEPRKVVVNPPPGMHWDPQTGGSD
jgi:PPOX class probable F420-dependent enzyme